MKGYNNEIDHYRENSFIKYRRDNDGRGLFTVSGLAKEADLKWTGCGITKKAFMAEAAAAKKNR
jgi:hypothetical protein